MDAQKRIDKILDAAKARVKEEVGALLGTELSITSSESRIVSKEQLFDTLNGKHIFAKVDLSGELEGLGGIVIGMKGAIHLGGTLIMLPPNELEEVAAREEYSEELDDSYGEIANIIAGAYTKTFEEMFKINFRFIRKELEILQPLNVDIASDEPLPDQIYYQVGNSLSMGDVDLGELSLLMPAAPFGLVDDVATDVTDSSEDTAVEADEVSPVAEADTDETGVGAEPETARDIKPVDFKKHLARVGKILAGCQEKLTEEVSALTGSEIKFSDHQTSFISKEDFFFDEVDGNQVLASLDVVGESEGAGYLYFSLKSAIHFGGTLIMLPESELEITIGDEDFTEDIKDAYGEIANIMTGAVSLAFEEQYPSQIRFIKKDVEQVSPMKVETGSDDPMPNVQFFMSSMAVTADGKDLGRWRLLFPASVLQLDQEEQKEGPPQEGAQDSVTAPPSGTDQSAIGQDVQPEPGAIQETAPPSSVDPDFNLPKHHKRVEKVLEECRSRIQSEVSELLGADFKFDGLDNRLVSKEDFFFEEVSGKQVLANMEVVGDEEGNSFFFVSLKDAIYTGGTLIMLPQSELENTVAEEEFNDDTADAFGEIANIISGVYTAVFEEQYSKNLRFIKKDLSQVVPMKVDGESDEPIPNLLYYMSGMQMTIAGEQKGKVHMLFPAELLQLEMLGREDELEAAQAAARKQAQSVGTAAASAADTSPITQAPSYEPADILVISEDAVAAEILAQGASAKGLAVRTIAFNADIRSALSPELQVVYLVMRDVTEQAFSKAITVRGASTLPLIAAGPAWTRSKVIKAVKYGVSDILLTPATADDVAENLDNNLARKAA